MLFIAIGYYVPVSNVNLELSHVDPSSIPGISYSSQEWSYYTKNIYCLIFTNYFRLRKGQIISPLFDRI